MDRLIQDRAGRTALLVMALALLAFYGRATADDALPMWQVDGESNRVYLLGSVHLLREGDYPLPTGLDAAYADAESLVMELDMDDLNPLEVQALVAEIGSAGEGKSLADLMGATYGDAKDQADALGIPLELMGGFEPWLAAISIEQLMLQRLGFDPAYGIEAHFTGRAVADGKEVLGLEEPAEQLGLLDALSADAQKQLLLQTLEEAGDIETLMDSIIGAWRTGDFAFLEANMLAPMREYPELYEVIVAERNRDWVGQIEDLLDDDDDYLIVVGALHLVGEDGVPALLEAAGYEPRQSGAAD